MSRIAGWIGEHVISIENARVVCPPGRIPDAPINEHPPILVPTVPRSGTHLLIDLLINNLGVYRNTPLYIDLDQLARLKLLNSDMARTIADAGPVVVKTHFPQWTIPGLEESGAMEFLKDAVVVGTQRDLQDSYNSAARWGLDNARSEKSYLESYQAFHQYWEGRFNAQIEFKSLFSTVDVKRLLNTVANLTGSTCRPRLIMPRKRTQRRRVYLDKFLTRVMGRHAPRLNTTIRFGR